MFDKYKLRNFSNNLQGRLREEGTIRQIHEPDATYYHQSILMMQNLTYLNHYDSLPVLIIMLMDVKVALELHSDRDMG